MYDTRFVRQVWKFPLLNVGVNPVPMPQGAEVIHVGQQSGNVMLWALVNPRAERVLRRYHVSGTGEDVPEGLYRGSVVMPSELVYHVFEV